MMTVSLSVLVDVEAAYLRTPVLRMCTVVRTNNSLCACACACVCVCVCVCVWLKPSSFLHILAYSLCVTEH